MGLIHASGLEPASRLANGHPRVLLSTDRLGWGNDYYHGAGRLFVEWTRGLLAQGVDVTPVVLRAPGALGERARREGLPIVFLDRGLFDPRTLFDLVRVMRERRIEVAHLQGYGAATFGRVAAAIVGVPTIVHVHTDHTFEAKGYPWYVRLLDRLLASRTDHILAVSEYARRFAIQDQGLPEDRVTVVHSPVDGTRFRPPTPAERARHRAEVGLAPDQMAVLCVTRFHPVKGVDVLLEAWPRIVADVPRAVLLLAGEGPLRNELEALAGRLGIAASVRFLGYWEDIEGLLATGDLAVIPSRSEGFCVAALEALATGLPVVATRAGGNPELIQEGINGLLVDSDDPPAMAAAVLRILEDGEQRSRLAAAARPSVAPYELQSYVRTLAERYREVIRSRSR